MHQPLSHDVQFMLVGLCILGGLLLLALGRMLLLPRANRRLHLDCVKMEKQAAEQQVEITAMHHDSHSWRARTQRQLDGVRSDLTHRLRQTEQAGQHAQQQLEDIRLQALAAAHAKMADLEAQLAAKVATNSLANPNAAAFASLPTFPAMATPCQQSLEAELVATQAELAASGQQNAELQRALLLARRRQPTLRKRNSRSA